jgi:hypothetical protein
MTSVGGKDRFLSLAVPFNGDPTKGIIAALSAKCGGNPHVAGLVRATCSGTYDGHEDHSPMHVLDPSDQKFFWSNKAPGAWITIEFVGRYLEATHYSLEVKGGSRQARTWTGSSWNTLSWIGTPKTWVIEGSIDGATWTEIDRQAGRDSPSRVYEVKTKCKARMIRMTAGDKNGGGTPDFMLDGLEFFGNLTDP